VNVKAKSCKRCLWTYKCDDGVPCEDYTPLDDDGDYETAAEEYEEDLEMRQRAYRDFLQEQSS
jgi:hypothetical protein